MASDNDPEKRRIDMKRGVVIVLVAVVAAVVVHGVAQLGWALCFDDSVRPPIGFSAFSQVRIAMLGAIMAGAAIFVWRRPGVVGGLCSVVFVLAIHLGDLLTAAWAALFYGFRSIGFPDFTAALVLMVVLYSVGVWALPLMSSILRWRLGVPLGTLILVASMAAMMWANWESMVSMIGTGNRLIWDIGSWFLRSALPILIGFTTACLMLPRERPRPMSVTTVPRSL